MRAHVGQRKRLSKREIRYIAKLYKLNESIDMGRRQEVRSMSSSETIRVFIKQSTTSRKPAHRSHPSALYVSYGWIVVLEENSGCSLHRPTIFIISYNFVINVLFSYEFLLGIQSSIIGRSSSLKHSHIVSLEKPRESIAGHSTRTYPNRHER
jgi:hypothetical protein